jgi:matrixin
MKFRFAAITLALAAAPGCITTDDPATSIEAQDLYVDGNHVWPGDGISVCWENPTQQNATEREWTRAAVAAAWPQHAAVDFYGWGACSSGQKGIRIQIDDSGPRTLGLGNQLDGVSQGMLLNFTFANWSTSCQQSRQFCIEAIAVHEFGHALGFAHEQNRSDTPNWCNQEQGSDGTYTIGDWDLDSVMNYCNPDWNGNGQLSATDIAGVRQVYGTRYRWESMGGGVINPEVGVNQDGRLELFVTGPTGIPHQKWENSPNSGNYYGGWYNMGGGLIGTMTVGRYADGRQVLFGRGGGNALYRNEQTAINSGWSGWIYMGGSITDPVVARAGDGRLELVARNASDGSLARIGQNGPYGAWGSWQTISGPVASRPSIARNQDGRLEMAVRGVNGDLLILWQTAVNGGWSAPYSLGGGIIGAPEAASNKDGRVQIFVVGGNNALYEIHQTQPNCCWSGYSYLGGWAQADTLRAGRNADGRLELFARGQDGTAHHMWQVSPGGAFSGWFTRGLAIEGRPAVANSPDGRLELFARGTDGALWHTWQTQVSGKWTCHGDARLCP